MKNCNLIFQTKLEIKLIVKIAQGVTKYTKNDYKKVLEHRASVKFIADNQVECLANSSD
jgi:hypothetical protein